MISEVMDEISLRSSHIPLYGTNRSPRSITMVYRATSLGREKLQDITRLMR